MHVLMNTLALASLCRSGSRYYICWPHMPVSLSNYGNTGEFKRDIWDKSCIDIGGKTSSFANLMSNATQENELWGKQSRGTVLKFSVVSKGSKKIQFSID